MFPKKEPLRVTSLHMASVKFYSEVNEVSTSQTNKVEIDKLVKSLTN